MFRLAVRSIVFCLMLVLCQGSMILARTMSNEQIVELIRKTFDRQTLLEGLEELRYFKAAGFIYQPALSVPSSDTCSVKEDWDQKAVMTGMVAADRSSAFLYGTYADVRRETAKLQALLPHVPTKLVSPEDQKALQKELDTKRGRQILVDRTLYLWDQLLKLASKNEQNLRFLGAFYYGELVERFYTAGIMILASAEAGELEPLFRVKVDRGSREKDFLMKLSAEGMIGDARHAADRDKKLREMFRLVSANGYRPPLKNVKKLVQICQDERNRYIVKGR